MDMCQRCERNGVSTIESRIDLRRVRMSCGYDMSEFDLPLSIEEMTTGKEGYTLPNYRLIVCKPCRADWLYAMETWFNSPHRIKMYANEITVVLNTMENDND